LTIDQAFDVKALVVDTTDAQNAVVLPSRLISILISSLSCPIGSSLSREVPITPLKIGMQTVT